MATKVYAVSPEMKVSPVKKETEEKPVRKDLEGQKVTEAKQVFPDFPA